MTMRRPRRVPLVLLTAAFALLMWITSTVTPKLDIPLPPRAALAFAFAAAGMFVMTVAVQGFRKQRTSVNPLDLTRTSAFVTTGVYRVSRNPMYLAMLLGLLALGCFLSNPISVGIAVLFVPTITRLQIIPEERVLSGRFGSAYTTYCATVRRWI